jgi:hypothetical protein
MRRRSASRARSTLAEARLNIRTARLLGKRLWRPVLSELRSLRIR